MCTLVTLCSDSEGRADETRVKDTVTEDTVTVHTGDTDGSTRHLDSDRRA